MLKRSIKLLIFTCVLCLSSLLSVSANSLYDKINPGDVIIGNTVFRSNTWISANRAAEAGSLYTLNTGEINKNMYLYDDLEDWYKYNNETDKYDLMSDDEVSDVEAQTNIYYENNKPLINTYESYVEYEYDEEYDEEYISYANEVYWFYNEMYGEIFVNDENVELDYENETITCPYHYVFDFQVVLNNEADNYKGICGLDNFEYVYEEEYNLEEIQIENIKLTDNTQIPSLNNQDKVDFSDGIINVLEELEVINYENNNEYYPVNIEGKYIAFDIEFKENNSCYNYTLMNSYDHYDSEYYKECVDSNTMRLFLSVDSYAKRPYSFLLIDNNFNSYEDLYIFVEGLERPSYDLTIENLEKVDPSIISNNSLIHSIVSESEVVNEYEYKYLSINTIGDLSVIDYNEMSNEWIAIDLYLNEDVNSDYLDISIDNMNSYEIIGNKIRLYLAEDTHVTIRDELTSSVDSMIDFGIRINKYDENSYITYNNGFNGVYGFYGLNGAEEMNLTKAPINYSSYNDVLYDKDNSKLYYKSQYDLLFMDDDSLKMITTIYNDDNEEVVIVKDVELYISYSANGHAYNNSPALMEDYESLFDHVSNEIANSEKELKVTIYTFFNRELTEIEQAEFAKFNDLVEAGIVEIKDISSSIYE